MSIASRKTLLALSLLAAVAGCGDKKSAKSDDQRTASGQILPGTTSDAMIAYDALTSQPPVAVHHAAAAAADSAEATDAAQPDSAAE